MDLDFVIPEGSNVNEEGKGVNQTNNEEKSNKCNQCDYASSRADKLMTHLKTHSGEKPYKCKQCDFASLRADKLRTHMKKHRGENQINQ